MDIFPAGEGVEQNRVAREVSQNPQLDLRVVGRKQNPSGISNKGAPDPASFLAARRNILKVGIGGAEAAGGGQRLVKRSMQPPILDQRRQTVDIGRFELGQSAIFQQLTRQFMELGKFR